MSRCAPGPRLRRGGGGGVASVPLALALLLAACVGPAPQPRSAQAQADAETVAACRQRADEAYDVTHRGTIYAPESEVNTPFSANYQPGVPDRGLSQLYEHDRMVSDCVRNTGAEGGRTPDQGSMPPPGPVARP